MRLGSQQELRVLASPMLWATPIGRLWIPLVIRAAARWVNCDYTTTHTQPMIPVSTEDGEIAMEKACVVAVKWVLYSGKGDLWQNPAPKDVNLASPDGVKYRFPKRMPQIEAPQKIYFCTAGPSSIVLYNHRRDAKGLVVLQNRFRIFFFFLS